MAKACHDLGMDLTTCSEQDLRCSDGESIADTAAAVSTYADIIGLRIHGRAVGGRYPEGNELTEFFAKNASSPVLNLECDRYHPCQALADLATLRTSFRSIQGRRIVVSWAYSPTAFRVPAVPIETLLLLSRFGTNLTLLHPPNYELEDALIELARQNVEKSGGSLRVSSNRDVACENADVLYARNWAPTPTRSSHLQSDTNTDLPNWTYTSKWLGAKAPACKYMHCLPVDRGHEASNELVDSAQSLVREQMKNRLVVQRRLLRLMLTGVSSTPIPPMHALKVNQHG